MRSAQPIHTMGILTKIEEEGDEWSLLGANIPDHCLVCADPLQFPLVYWAGYPDTQIWLHPSCARKLGRNFIADASKAELAMPDPPP